MFKNNSFSEVLLTLFSFIRYNARQVFAGKFIYFVSAAVAIFLLVAIIYVINEAVPPGAEELYYILLTPGVLLIFYPSAFAIQQDVDARMLETLFGIPDYRYKIWIVRIIVQYMVVMLILLLLASFSYVTLADFNILEMVFHLLFPLLLLGSIAFAAATITRSGNGAAIVMIIIVLSFWIASEPLTGSRWDLFHNPYGGGNDLAAMGWGELTFYNRLYILVGSIVSMMYGLLRLQKREKFI